MTKSELIKQITDKLKNNKHIAEDGQKTVSKALEQFLTIVGAELKEKGEFSLHGFGKFVRVKHGKGIRDLPQDKYEEKDVEFIPGGKFLGGLKPYSLKDKKKVNL